MKFISGNRGYTTFVKVNGARRVVAFTDMGNPYNYGYFSTRDEELIAVLKKHPDFNHVFFESEPHEEVTAPEKVYDKVYEDVKKTQEAKQILINEYAVAPDTIKSKADVLRIAEEKNVNFPNL